MLITSESTTPEDLITYLTRYSYKDEVEILCPQCKTEFSRTKKRLMCSVFDYKNSKKRQSKLMAFCSRSCNVNYHNQKLGYGTSDVECKQCAKVFRKSNQQIKLSVNDFCSRSCSASYNNTHKTHGTRRSKLEVWLEDRLKEMYPHTEIHFNRKDTINSELDMYFPTINLAIELNGVFHYEPIYGAEKLTSIQNNDERKFQACIEKGIELCIIDVSKLTYFKEKTATKYLNIILTVLEKKGLRPRAEV